MSRCRSRTTCAFSRTARHGRSPWYWWIRIMGRLAPGATPAQAARIARADLPGSGARGLARWPLRRSPAGRMSRCPICRRWPPIRAGRARTTCGVSMRRPLRDSDGARRARARWRRAPTSPICCSRAAPLGAARSRCGSPSVRAAAASSGNSSPNRCCSRSRAPRSAWPLAWWGRGLLLALRPFGNASVSARSAARRPCARLHACVARSRPRCSSGSRQRFGATRVDLTAQFQSGTRTLGGARPVRASGRR